MYDLVVIGGGPGGYVAAIKGAHLGLKVALIEATRLGGTCLNRGCIPTKALYRSSYVGKILKNAESFGFDVQGFSVNYLKIKERKDIIVENLVKGIETLIKGNKIDYYHGKGQVIDKNTVLIEELGQEIKGEKLLIATGSKPFIPPIPGADLKGVLTSDEVLELTTLPKKMAIIGGGVVGTEFAGIFANLGVEVTLIEMLPRILYNFDEELVRRLNVFLKKAGVNILTSAKVERIEKADVNNEESELVLAIQTNKGVEEIRVNLCLMAGGRKPNLKGLEKLNLTLKDNGGILTNEKMETNIPDVYAVGDCTGGIMLAHVASQEGIVAVENIAGKGRTMDYRAVPSVVFTYPELASVGLTEEGCKEKNIDYKVSKFNFAANGKAMAEGEIEGTVKVIADLEDRIIGVHILGPHSSDLIAEGVLAVQHRLKAKDIYNTIHAHPTLSETFAEACHGIDGEIIHGVPKRK
ncbi:dihydrolipoamide dehydrogenase [Anaerobranca californiensis DSM 14826]|jgi:dihydrolipoamide dehydrogenase|uniref:Dihydrolipoyl dehydrogenase n=1 Tax=Anaerobranca californiensis DSM 14826 TaxID=1120989 RepID=A0A1M6L8E2_9FIRM|nr:dihydrolipoyl dehydrogenase [Anaerobranca californiensis]SHJ67460.1 dihydrolipoamide dehydrogenase [Anaerobranca californiensis DSM 14826]